MSETTKGERFAMDSAADPDLEQRLSSANRDLLAAKGSLELLREILLRQGGVKGLASDLLTNVRVLEAVRANIKSELARVKKANAEANQFTLGLGDS